MPGIPRSSWDYSWGRTPRYDERDEVEVEHDFTRDYCPVCDKKAVIYHGACMACEVAEERKGR
jgi:hypothetical protein